MSMDTWIGTFVGGRFSYTNPETSNIDVVDIAHALSNVCRFAGHTREFYSVAQHSVLVSLNVPPEDAIDGLMHDASEAYLGDVASPLKWLLPDYKIIEAKCEDEIRRRFGLGAKKPPSVKIADMRMLATERRDLINHDGTEWLCLAGVDPYDFRITPMAPKDAERLFLLRFKELVG